MKQTYFFQIFDVDLRSKLVFMHEHVMNNQEHVMNNQEHSNIFKGI